MPFPCHVFNILTMTLLLPENQHFPRNDLSSVLIPAGVRRRPCHQSRVELISIDWMWSMLCRLCAGCLNLHEAESWNKKIKGQVGVAIQTNIKVSSHSIVSSKPLLIGCNTTICPRSCVLWRQLWEPRFVLEPPQMYPSALCQVWAWPAQMSKHFPNTVASSCYTCNRAIWLICLSICNWNTVYIPQNKAPGTSPWFHFLN